MFALVSFALSALFYRALFVSQLGPLDASIVCESDFLISCGSPIISHIIFSMFHSLITGILSSAGQSPDIQESTSGIFIFVS